jgi:hypothetical protein
MPSALKSLPLCMVSLSVVPECHTGCQMQFLLDMWSSLPLTLPFPRAPSLVLLYFG